MSAAIFHRRRHDMICPKCNSEMTQVVKYGVPIDTCTTCSGVWLDKGELGELMARINQAGSTLDQELSRVQPPPRADYGRPPQESYHQPYGGHHDDYDHHDKYKHKKRSIWDIFD
jgi:Zn-finger nucleic acid-binding protein